MAKLKEIDSVAIDIPHYVRITNGLISRDGQHSLGDSPNDSSLSPEAVYEMVGCTYPKFFKMDILCKWAWLAAEHLLIVEGTPLYEQFAKEKVAVVLFTRAGCIEADKKYQESVSSIPSPALFVYTLPNIMAGEICIRHGFKGEQLCMVQDQFDSNELLFWVQHLMEQQGMEACLCGWVDVTNSNVDISLFWAVQKVTTTGARSVSEINL